MTEINKVIAAWKPYLEEIVDWEALVQGITPKETTCGPVYELDNPIDRPNESFAIADMRELDFAVPHKHINGETEIYYALKGFGTVAVGEQVSRFETGTFVITPPDTYHATLPGEGLVVAVINTPPFDARNVVEADDNQVAVTRTILGLKDSSI